jgi:hypothetical protein
MADKEYIEREALEKQIDEAQNKLISNDDRIWNMNRKYFKGLAWARRLLLDAPTADVVEVRRGEWKRYMTGNGWDYWEDLICPFCEKKHEKPRFKMNFCPNCGADMRGDKDG